MLSTGRKAVLSAAALLTALAGAWFALPAAAEDNSSEGPTAAEYQAEADRLKLENAWVSPEADLQFGAEPLQFAQAAAATAAEQAACAISPEEATALSIAMTWPEVAPSGEPPSPMTLSRYDVQPTLGDPEGRAEGLWFHPGIGMWQLDSAGLGSTFSAAQAIDAENSANHMVPFIVNKYCDAINSGSAPAAARSHAWTDWVACRSGACEDTFNRALAGVTPVDGVGRHGGGEVRECLFGGVSYECLYVNAANAQGANWWASPGGGRSPVAAPFYVFNLDDGQQSTEVRYWFAADSGAAVDVQALRPYGSNARDSLQWSEGQGLCDVTTGTGAC